MNNYSIPKKYENLIKTNKHKFGTQTILSSIEHIINTINAKTTGVKPIDIHNSMEVDQIVTQFLDIYLQRITIEEQEQKDNSQNNNTQRRKSLARRKSMADSNRMSSFRKIDQSK